MQNFAGATGGCNCGQLRYSISSEPLACYICHCHQCQKRTGSAFSMSLVMQVGSLEITSGRPVESERELADGSKNRSYTCAACHSRIYAQKTSSQTLNLRAGTLDDTSQVRPIAQVWVSSAQPWAVQPGILSYSEQPTDLRPMLHAWKHRLPPA